jgi:hypothetical protein
VSSKAPSTPPTRTPAAGLVASLLAIGLIALAVVAVRDLAVAQGWTTGSPWTPPAVSALDGLTANGTVLAVGGVAGVLALVLLYVVLKPARKTHGQGGDASTDLWVSPGAVATLAREAAERTAGVRAAEARATRRSVSVTVAAEPGAPDVEAAVRASVEEQLAGLANPTVKVRSRRAEETSE